MEKMSRCKKICNVLNGLLTRLIFVAHGTLSFILLYKGKNLTQTEALFLIPLCALLLEGPFTLYVRSGKEMKYVWPCGFLYIATIVPMIWVLELDLLESRQGLRAHNTTMKLIVRKTDDITKGKAKTLDELLLDALTVSDLDSTMFCEVGVFIGLIVGRWLTPRSSMSREQLSTLLLSYVANAADILELFESFKSRKIVYNTSVTVGILSVYTWALLQFALVTTVTSTKKKERRRKVGGVGKNVELNIVELPRPKELGYVEMNSECETRSEGGERANSIPRYEQINHPAFDENGGKLKNGKCCVCHPEYPQLLCSLFMQDGPFLILRLVLSIKFKVVSELHLFFLCKNALVCILLFHRMMVLAFDNDVTDTQKKRHKCNDVAIVTTHEKSYGIDNFIGKDDFIPDKEEI